MDAPRPWEAPRAQPQKTALAKPGRDRFGEDAARGITRTEKKDVVSTGTDGLTITIALAGHSEANSRVARIASGTSSRWMRRYPRYSKNSPPLW